MKIRWKLLALLTATALLPLALVTGFSQVRGRQVGLRLSAETRDAFIAAAQRELQQLVDGNSSLFWQRGEALTLAVRAQAREAERLLATTQPSVGDRIFAASAFDEPDNLPVSLSYTDSHFAFQANSSAAERIPVSYDAQAFHLAPDADAPRAREQMRQLEGMVDLFQILREEVGEHVLWQYIGMESGLHLSYPGHGGYPADFDPRRRQWYQFGRTYSEPGWVPSLIDASTKQVVVPLAAPIRDSSGHVVGVTGIDVTLLTLLDSVHLPAEWFDIGQAGARRETADATTGSAGQVIVCILRNPPGAAEPGLSLWAYQGYESAGTAWDQPIQQQWFVADDPAEQRQLVADIVAERERLLAGEPPAASTVRRLHYAGREHFWAHRQFEKYPEVLFSVLVPYDQVVAHALAAEERFQNRIMRQMGLALGMVLALAVAVVVAALIVSREFTRPIRTLAQAALRVAGGDLETRAEVRRGDELGDLAQTFNDMLPQLQDRLRLRHSLSLAMEVQQNLLPDAPPSVPGLDIHGQRLYCDETGGDYYDFIEIEPVEHRAILAAVGDVTGHGVAAALLMTTARALLRSRSSRSGELAQVVTDINRQLSDDAPQGRFMTLFLLLVDQREQRLCWVSAGHDPALLYDPAADRFDEFGGDDIPLGIDGAWQFHQRLSTFPHPGCVLVIGTDGIWEARNDDEEMYGKQRLRESIRRHAGKPAADLSRALSDDLAAFLGGRSHQDDATLVVIRFLVEGD